MSKGYRSQIIGASTGKLWDSLDIKINYDTKRLEPLETNMRPLTTNWTEGKAHPCVRKSPNKCRRDEISKSLFGNYGRKNGVKVSR